VIDKLGKAEAALVDLALDVGAAKGGDADAAQKARRSLIELDALLLRHALPVAAGRA
jgi:molecular chaperone DnaK